MYQATLVERVKAAVIQRVLRARQSSPGDHKVIQAAEKRLQASPYAALRSITCEFHHGTLVLRGRVESYYLKQLAQETVRSLEGVGGIVNIVEARREGDGASRSTAAAMDAIHSGGEYHVSAEPKAW